MLTPSVRCFLVLAGAKDSAGYKLGSIYRNALVNAELNQVIHTYIAGTFTCQHRLSSINIRQIKATPARW